MARATLGPFWFWRSIDVKAAPVTIATVLWVSVFAATALAAECNPMPDGVDPDAGYRVGHYSAPVPDCAPGAVSIAYEEAKMLAQGGGAILLDVTPIDGSDPDPFDGTWAVPEPHETIPGATWLPEAGRGKPEAWLEKYLRSNVDKLVAESPGIPVIVFCNAECWGSWNAAKRLAAWGYADIHWYARGIDDWRDKTLPLEIADPIPADVE
jgi:PQQ-dependent catabolism-associated CXXCW motif protein